MSALCASPGRFLTSLPSAADYFTRSERLLAGLSSAVGKLATDVVFRFGRPSNRSERPVVRRLCSGRCQRVHFGFVWQKGQT